MWDNLEVSTASSGNNLIKWWTLPEYRVKEFIIQGSDNGHNFHAFRRIAVEKHDTRFTIEDRAQGNQFYRLICIDDKGNISYSKIVTIKSFQNSSLFFYDGKNTIYIKSPLGNIEDIGLINISGRVFKYSKNMIQHGSLNIGFLPQGLYIMEASGKEHFTTKFIKR
ncbi:MAG: hypothetical protein NVS1B13_04010 [Flavisolibacter sp.]